MEKKYKELINIIGILCLFGTTFVLIATFILAYLSPSKSILVTINNYFESYFEMFILLPLVLITGAYSVYYNLFGRDQLEEKI